MDKNNSGRGMRTPVSLFALGALTMVAGGVHAQVAPLSLASGLALYSDACVNEQSGDLLGTRIGILQLNRGHEVYFFYQDAEGEWQEPQIIQLHRGEGDVMGSNISFSVRWGDQTDAFHGTVTDKLIVGEFQNPRHTNERDQRQFRLLRVSPDQKGYPDCR
jgi:hypothetical protein